MDKADATPIAAAAAPSRRFARFELRQLVGRSAASAAWLARDPNIDADVLLCVPRAQPASPAQREEWSQEVLAGARLKHPRLAEALDIGVHDGWPYVAYERGNALTLVERLQAGQPAASVVDMARWVVELLEGLAYAHEAGAAHHDLALHNVMLDAAGHVRVAALSVGWAATRSGGAGGASRQEQRVAAERDVLMAGLLLHRLLAGHPALDDADLGNAASRVGPEIVRLPWSTPQPVPETLRAIVNRATDRQHRQRYLNARTLLSALQGWITTNGQDSTGPLDLLLDRLNTVGHLPSRARDMAPTLRLMQREELKVDEMVDHLARDPALAWELLRVINTARFQGSTDEAACSLSRAIVLLGQQGLRKVCSGVRTWPGVLQASSSLQGQDAGSAAVEALDTELKLACVAAVTARWLRPFNVSDEEAMMAAMSQRLGHLLLRYHFPEECAQIDRLMAPAPPSEPDGKPTPGMTLEAATGAVMGINADELTAGVLRHWGFAENFVQAARPLSTTVAPRRPEGPDDWLRITASLANELCTLVGQTQARQQQMLAKILSRYARPALTSQREVLDALQRGLKAIDPALHRRTFPVEQPAVVNQR